MEKVRMFSYLLSRLSESMKDQEYILPRWIEHDQTYKNNKNNKNNNNMLKEVIVVKPFSNYELVQNGDKLTFMGRKPTLNR